MIKHMMRAVISRRSLPIMTMGRRRGRRRGRLLQSLTPLNFLKPLKIRKSMETQLHTMQVGKKIPFTLGLTYDNSFVLK